MHATMINIGLVCVVALKIWKNAVNIMIEKDKGSPKLHRLRVIELMEADLKFCISTVFGKRIMDFTTKYFGLSDNQYVSRRGHLCQSAIMNKLLTYGILRILKKKDATADFDTVANYDRMIN